MNRLNLAWWCWISLGVERLLTVKAGESYPEAAAKFQQDLQWRIWYSYEDNAVLRLHLSSGAARELLQILTDLTANADRTEAIMEEEAKRLTDAAAKFKVVYEEELAQVVVYAVEPKGIYDTEKLVDHADESISPASRPALGGAVIDLRAAGRCLAFALPTAAGFHIARATETVIRSLMEQLGCSPPKDSQRNWGKYIELLEKAGADPLITHHLKQVKDLHRNPLIHPEHSLGMTDAVILWSICTSLIERMCQDVIRLHGEKARAVMEKAQAAAAANPEPEPAAGERDAPKSV